MLNEGSTHVLIAITDRNWRQKTARALRAAGFEVWEAQDYDEAVSLLHASPHRLVMLVGCDLVSVLGFAAVDRRLAHHHIYIVLDTEERPLTEEACEQFSCLTVWRLASPTPHDVMQSIMKAARLLDTDPARIPELVAL